ncbi:MAG: Cob(I)yrinic acid a,c-diamide adenosyltransferase [Microgenomates bacterium OLB22]|nr:MAG: Cob(I)yrinic acid a,c-diamide adenosyltransferase [Microgenomates bacterium OLB22]
MSVYTKTGDTGNTGLWGKKRVAKDSAVIEACGTIDELSSFIGMVLSFPIEKEDQEMLQATQHDAYLIMAHLAGSETKVDELLLTRVNSFEKRIDALTQQLPVLNSFIYPRGSLSAVWFHLARSVCRRAERRLVACPSRSIAAISYLNRLSDLLFMLSRYYNTDEIPVTKLP